MGAPESALVRFRQFCLDDIDDLVRLCNEDEIAKWTLAIPHPYTKKSASEWVQYCSQLPETRREYAIEYQSKLVGSIGYSINQHLNATIGYWVGAEVRGRGIASEACLRLIEFLFTKTPTKIVRATHMVGNRASHRVLEKCWLTEEGVLKGWVMKNGQSLDCVMMSLNRTGFVALTNGSPWRLRWSKP